MAWVRVIKAFGYVDDNTPELAISVLSEHRGKRIGQELMNALFDELRSKRYKQTSLAVQKANRAFKFYLELGYEIVGENNEEYIMKKIL